MQGREVTWFAPETYVVRNKSFLRNDLALSGSCVSHTKERLSRVSAQQMCVG